MIAVVGHTAVDYISRVISFPPPNGSTTILDRKVYFGGGAANIAVGIASLGERCTLVSAVGPDFAGSEYDRWMKEAGIVQQFFVDPEANTPTAFMFTDPAGDQITFFEWGASRQFSHSDAPSFPFVHLATADPSFNVKVAEKSDFTSFDPGQDLHRYTASDLFSVIRHTSLLFANQHEVEGMCRTMDVSREALIGMVPMALFTMSDKGSTLYHEGESHFIPAIPVTCTDPTGAGDAYRAGFLAAYRRGIPPVACARVGTVTASFVVEKAGCQTNLPGWEDMKKRYENFFGRFDY